MNIKAPSNSEILLILKINSETKRKIKVSDEERLLDNSQENI